MCVCVYVQICVASALVTEFTDVVRDVRVVSQLSRGRALPAHFHMCGCVHLLAYIHFFPLLLSELLVLIFGKVIEVSWSCGS